MSRMVLQFLSGPGLALSLTTSAPNNNSSQEDCNTVVSGGFIDLGQPDCLCLNSQLCIPNIPEDLGEKCFFFKVS